jgi:hypothetical protein
MKKYLFAAVLFLAACGHPPRSAAPPQSTSSAPGITVVQTGDAAVPATASSEEAAITVALPKGSTVTVSSTGEIVATLSEHAVMSAKTAKSTATGATAFTPPAPPTPEEWEWAKAVKWFYITGVVCALLAVLCFGRGYPMMGFSFVGGAIGVPALGKFVSNDAAVYILVGTAVAAGAFWLAWQKLKKHTI